MRRRLVVIEYDADTGMEAGRKEFTGDSAWLVQQISGWLSLLPPRNPSESRAHRTTGEQITLYPEAEAATDITILSDGEETNSVESDPSSQGKAVTLIEDPATGDAENQDLEDAIKLGPAGGSGEGGISASGDEPVDQGELGSISPPEDVEPVDVRVERVRPATGIAAKQKVSVQSQRYVIVRKKALDQARRHAGEDTSREVGGVLLGRVIPLEKHGPTAVITGIVRGVKAVGTPTSLNFSPEAWAAIWRRIDAHEDYGDDSIVGWYHTHPSLRVFMSSLDRNIHKKHFTHPLHVALVLDPVSGEQGFFCWDESQRRLYMCDKQQISDRSEGQLANLLGCSPTQLPVAEIPAGKVSEDVDRAEIIQKARVEPVARDREQPAASEKQGKVMGGLVVTPEIHGGQAPPAAQKLDDTTWFETEASPLEREETGLGVGVTPVEQEDDVSHQEEKPSRARISHALARPPGAPPVTWLPRETVAEEQQSPPQTTAKAQTGPAGTKTSETESDLSTGQDGESVARDNDRELETTLDED